MAQTILSHLRNINIMRVYCLSGSHNFVFCRFDAVLYCVQASRRDAIFVEKQGENQYAFRRNGIYTRQLEFLHLLRDYLIERGDLQKRDLIQAPFTLIHPEGIRGVFSPREIEEILEMAKKLVA
jgi:hypothetical protein